MASRKDRISAAFTLITSKLNDIFSKVGDLSTLSTTNQSSTVAAINEVKSIADAAAGGGASINDSVTNTSTAWSGSKVNTEITSAITNALEGEDLSDLADEIAALQVTDAGLVSANSAQSFNATQIAQAQANINAADLTEVGDTDYDFAADITSNLTF